MNPYQKARQLFLENQFHSAAQFYYAALQEEVLSLHDKIDCYQKIIKICHYTKTHFDRNQIRGELAELYQKNEMWSKASEIFYDILKEVENYFYLKNYWLCLVHDGQIKKANEILIRLLDYLLIRKNLLLCFSVLEEAEVHSAPKKIISTYRIKALVIQGNRHQVDEELKGVLTDSVMGIANHSGLIYQHLEEVVLLERSYWKTTRVIQEIKLQGLLNTLTRRHSSKEKQLANRKEFIRSFYDYVLNFGENVGVLGLLVKYSLHFECKELGENALAILEKGHKAKDFKDKNFNPEELKEMFSLMDESQRFETEDFDLATDLFSDDSEEGEEARKIRVLERDIGFLLEHNQEKKAFELLKELHELNPHHKYEREYHEMMNREAGSQIASKKQTPLEIQKDLLREISLYSSREEDKGEEAINQAFEEKSIMKMIEYIRPEILDRNYNDLVASMIAMEMYRPAKLIIDIMIRRSELKKVSERVNLIYLDAIVAFEEGDYFKVSELVDDALAELPLLLEEKKCLVYLKGEAYLKKKNIREALICFRAVQEIDPSYRLVSYRLRDIEQN